MAVSTPSQNAALAPIADNDSDYGSDIDDATADELLSQAESQPLTNIVLESIEEPAVRDESLHERSTLRLTRLQQSLESLHESSSKLETLVSDRRTRDASVEVEYDEANRTSFSPSNPAEPLPEETVEANQADTRSPIERFRKPPKKPLSVTDLVSPAWCEQQYEYSLTKYGRVRQTPAMKQGSSVHKELEEQVHVQVTVQTVTKEDRFGLRLWNAITGLRTLREKSLTRELEVFGVIEDEVVIGIIDEIGTTCPDEKMEAAILEDLRKANTGGKGSKTKPGQLPPDQQTLTGFLTSSQKSSVLESNPAFLGTLQEERPKTFYIKDVKTRQSRTLPAPGSASRPTHMQLMLYHILLTNLASNAVSGTKIFERYRLKPEKSFSDEFIAQIASHDIVSPPSSSQSHQPDPLTEVLEYNTLSSLWSLLISEFAMTFPTKLGQASISPLLTAEFRTAAARRHTEVEDGTVEAAGTLIGQRSFSFDARIIQRYIKSEMAWWKGERETQGVDIEEAFKCRICEFAEGCTWRATKIEEGLEKARLRKGGKRKSEV